MNRPVFTPELIARLIVPLTQGEMMELFSYADAEGWGEFLYRTTEWLMKHYNLTLPAGTDLAGPDVALVIKRILPLEHE